MGQPLIFPNEEISILSALAEFVAIAIERPGCYERVVDVEEQIAAERKSLSVLGLLAAEVAHEIRNPLTVMKLPVSLAGFEISRQRPAREGCPDH